MGNERPSSSPRQFYYATATELEGHKKDWVSYKVSKSTNFMRQHTSPEYNHGRKRECFGWEKVCAGRKEGSI
jgi:hypothetical protein